MKRSRGGLIYGLVAGACALYCTDASAQANSWTNSMGGKWETPGNWSDGAPTSSHAANLITNPSTKSVTIDATTSGNFPGTMIISNLTLSAPGSDINTLHMNNAGEDVPLHILNSLSVGSNAVLVVTNSVLRTHGQSGGSFTVDGSITNLSRGQILSTNVSLSIGSTASSRGNITTMGGLLHASNNVFVGTAAGSAGALTLAGGTNTITGILVVGHLANATGAVWVTDGLLVATNGNTIIGSLGVGQMTVSNGTVLANQIQLGPNGGSGTLTIAGGTNSFSGGLTIAQAGFTPGTVWVTGGLLVLTNAPTTVGNGGFGQMTVSNGTWLATNVVVGALAGSHGTLTVAGGTNTLSGALTVSRTLNATGSLFVAGGLLVVTNSTTTVATNGTGQATVSDGTVLLQHLTVGTTSGGPVIRSDGTFTVLGGTTTLSGTLLIGSSTNSTGAVWVTGDSGLLVVTNNITTIANFGIGQMTVSNGTVLSRDVTVSSGAGSRGTLAIAGGTNMLSGPLTVGRLASANGSVFVTGGLLVATNGPTIFGSNGVAQVTQTGGTVIFKDVTVGQRIGAHGTITVGGGTNTVLTELGIGVASSTTGTVWVTDGQLGSSNVLFYLGNAGVGQMTVSNGSVLGQEIRVGNLEGSQGTLNVAGGTVFSGLTVGNVGTGTVWVTGGQMGGTNISPFIGGIGPGQVTVSNGTFLAAAVSLGYTPGSSGTFTVAGGTNFLSNALRVGDAVGSTAAVWMTGGALVVTNITSEVGRLGDGQMTVSNGTWRALNVVVGSSAGSQGTLTVAGGTHTFQLGLRLGRSDCTATGTLVIASGQLLVTNSVNDATLEVRSGKVTQSGGLLQVNRLVITNACGRFVRSGGVLTKNQLILDPDLDADGDGLPNGWEQMFGLDPLVATGDDGPDADADGDGVSNLDEFLAGTDPVEFRITSITREGNDIRVAWKTFGDNTYFVQTNSVGMTGSFTNNFTNLSPPIVIPFGAPAGTTNFLHIGGATNVPALYYRGRLVP